MVNRPSGVPAEAAAEAGPRDRPGRDERAHSDEAAAGEDPDAAELLTSLDRELDRDRSDDTLHERPVDANGAREWPLGHDGERAAPPADLRSRVDAARLHDGDDAVLVEAPREECGKVAIAPRA